MSLHIGLISGTSVDAVDTVLVDFELALPRIVATREHPIPPRLRQALLGAAARDSLQGVLRLDVSMGEVFAQSAIAILRQSRIPPSSVRAIGSHGQTVLHQPSGEVPYTLQIGDPNIIAERTGITTVADFRRRDMAAGGQGAPLAPAYHCALFRHPDRSRVIVNVGGIANITVLPSDPAAAVHGFDTGPGNGLMDAWIAKHRGDPFDRDASWARSGQVNESLLSKLEGDDYFAMTPPKSTGRDYFNLEWLEGIARRMDTAPSPVDVQRTLCELSARTIATAIGQHAGDAGEVLICGGGAHNPLLRARLGARLDPTPLAGTDDYGMDPDYVEAAAFAWLARQTLAGMAGNLPSVTGASRHVPLGGIYLAGSEHERRERIPNRG